ncbi:conjugal transfer protein TraF [Campylobacter upsaliensis]|nr:conjugal transfer protein TraF [Campylobacter upsaliensis]
MKTLLILILFCSLAFANTFFKNKKDGWFYYKENNITQQEENKTKQLKEDEEFLKNIPIDNLDSLSVKEYKETFERVKEIAVMKPTKGNVALLQKMNKFQLQQSEKFAKVWVINNLENPELEFPQINTTKFAKNQFTEEKEEKRKIFFKQREGKLSFIVFFTDENKLESQRLIMKLLNDKYGVKTHYINALENEALAKKLKLDSSIEIFFHYFNKNDEEIYMRVKQGYTTAEEIIDNTQFLFENALLEEDK